eukprot:406816_1
MDEDWSPDGGNSTLSLGDDSDEYVPPKKTRRRTSSRKRNLSSDHSKDADMVETTKPRRSRRHSKTHEPINLEDSDSDDSRDTQPITVNSNSIQSKSTTDPGDDSEDIVIISSKPTKKRATRKRKAEDASMDDDSPPLKKRRTATATNTCKTKGTLKKKETQTKSKTTKSKKKVLLKGNEATERLKEFMIAQNRPHSKNS